MADQKQEKHNFHSMIPWYVLKKHFEHLSKLADKKWLDSDDPNVELRAKGEKVLLRKLMNLPETLTLIQEDEINAESH